MLAKRMVIWIATCLMLTSAKPTAERSHSGGDQRIYIHGGRPVRSGEFPFLVLLVISDAGVMGGLCSGSIPSRTTVLTAEHCHCHRGRGDITAYAGLISIEETERRNANVQRRWVKSMAKYHPTRRHDIMVCYVNEPWVWTQFVAPVALCSESVGATSEVCQVMGFGQTEPDIMGGVAHVMEQRIYDISHCEDLFPGSWIMSQLLCTKDVEDKTVCMGDSGGPAMCGGRQGGINKALLPLYSGQEDVGICLPAKAANVYMDVSYYRKWLDKMIVLSSAESIHRCSMKISKYEEPLHPPLWLLLSMTVELLSLQ